MATIIVVAGVGVYALTRGHAQSTIGKSAGKSAGPGKPLACPAGSVRVSPGAVPSLAGSTAYCFAAGTYHRFRVTPQNGDRFYGGGHTTLDGDNAVSAAFSGSFSSVTIDGFTIRNYSVPVPREDVSEAPGVINVESGATVTISNNTIGPDRSSGVSIGPGCYDYDQAGRTVDSVTVTHNVVHDVGDSGIAVNCSNNSVVSDNEIYHTNQWKLDSEWGNAALGKFAFSKNSTVIGNWVSCH